MTIPEIIDSTADDRHVKGNGNRIFISSTSYDLEDLRAEVASTLVAWGFEPICHESPDFPVKDGLHSHDVCLDEVKECDIYLLIVSRRYGGIYAGNKYPKEDISITWYETMIAYKEKKRMLLFVRETVWAERGTYNHNLKEGVNFRPFHVDNVKIFEFIDFIVHQSVDNWVDQFKNVVDLKERLRKRLGIQDAYNLPYFERLNKRLSYD